MNHQKVYDSIIQKAKSENRKKLKKTDDKYVYYENHHILPKCLGGGEEKENKVLLTAREHYICHKLLTYIYTNNRKIILAFHYMMCGNKIKEYINISPKDYAYMKEKLSLNGMTDEQKTKISNTLKGRKHSIERINKTRESNKGKTLGRKYPNRKRPVLTQEHKNNISKGWVPCGYCKPKNVDSPEFSNDFDYPEIRKPVHIERDQFAKALF